jgi:hypothetical protein
VVVRTIVAPALALALVACGAADGDGDDGEVAPRYVDVVDLFDRGIARTCALNNGVCHNSNNYPDLHSVANLVATVGLGCNADATDPLEVHDACEPPADRLVIPSAGLDARIVSAALDPAEVGFDVEDLTEIRLVLDPAPPADLPVGATDTEVHRGSIVFLIGEYDARVQSVTGAEVVLDLRSSYGNWTAKRFFDVRIYPPGPNRVVVGDPNGNGVEGALAAAMPLVAAGDPAGSYLMRRLTDEAYGELMPRQCRTWDDRANEALACWIAGLVVDADGAVTNAYDPIDYTDCGMDTTGLGKCAPVAGAGFAAVETLLLRSCAGTGCHVGELEPAGGLDLSAGRAHESLVGVASTVVTDRLRVDPGSPDTSYLLCKLEPDCSARRGARMPLDAEPLPATDLDVIRAWIDDGAPP